MNNNRIGEDSIRVTPIDEQGMLELFCRKVTEDYEYDEESYQFCNYELRWRPIDEESTVSTLVGFVAAEFGDACRVFWSHTSTSF